jgi:NAD(P)-dependent dehydrogenase (short-subunit alcohol dehydrogenase family)
MRALGYGASKAARDSAAVLLAVDLRGTDIKITSVHPALLKTSKGGDRADMGSADGAAPSSSTRRLPQTVNRLLFVPG